MWKNLKVLVTGATGGLGEPLCKALAAAGAQVIVHARDQAKAEVLAKTIGADAVGADLSSLDATCDLARSVGAIDVLINNAGIGFGADKHEREVSVDGFELRMAVNYFAPFMLTNALLRRDHVRAIVNVASAGQLAINFENFFTERSYDGVDAYRHSKLALVMFTFDLAAAQAVPVNTLHPGTFLDTGMVRAAGITPQGTAQSGCDAIVFVGEQTLAGNTGGYYNVKSLAKADPQAYDLTARAKLRELTLRLTDKFSG